MLYSTWYIKYVIKMCFNICNTTSKPRLYITMTFNVTIFMLYYKLVCHIAHSNLPDVESPSWCSPSQASVSASSPTARGPVFPCPLPQSVPALSAALLVLGCVKLNQALRLVCQCSECTVASSLSSLVPTAVTRNPGRLAARPCSVSVTRMMGCHSLNFQKEYCNSF